MTGNVTSLTNSWVQRNELHGFARQVKQYLNGSLSADEFLAIRLQNGVYGQRQDDYYMLRIKIPGGFLTTEQLDCIGKLVSQYSKVDFANITTRQDIQLHFVELPDVPKILLRLADVGLTTREACGNTVRNVTACPYAGQCEQEKFNANAVVEQISRHCLRHPLTQFLPRKFKISVSGCEQDCAMGMIQDLAIIATQREGEIGFKVRVAGGLGHKPRESIELESFVAPDALLTVVESVIQLHNDYSDRKRRAKSRLKFLIDRFGEAEFKRLYRVQWEKTRKRHQYQPDKRLIESRRDASVSQVVFFGQGRSLELAFSKGDISSEEIDKLVSVLKPYPHVNLQTLQNQNLLLRNVKPAEYEDLQAELESWKFSRPGSPGDKVACPGSWTCRLGITASRAMLDKLTQDDDPLSIHVSGCHNGCAQPQVADIGLHGEARRLFGYLVPYYRLYLGGLKK